jgi:hypothetical protein
MRSCQTLGGGRSMTCTGERDWRQVWPLRVARSPAASQPAANRLARMASHQLSHSSMMVVFRRL